MLRSRRNEIGAKVSQRLLVDHQRSGTRGWRPRAPGSDRRRRRKARPRPRDSPSEKYPPAAECRRRVETPAPLPPTPSRAETPTPFDCRRAGAHDRDASRQLAISAATCRRDGGVPILRNPPWNGRHRRRRGGLMFEPAGYPHRHEQQKRGPGVVWVLPYESGRGRSGRRRPGRASPGVGQEVAIQPQFVDQLAEMVLRDVGGWRVRAPAGPLERGPKMRVRALDVAQQKVALREIGPPLRPQRRPKAS